MYGIKYGNWYTFGNRSGAVAKISVGINFSISFIWPHPHRTPTEILSHVLVSFNRWLEQRSAWNVPTILLISFPESAILLRGILRFLARGSLTWGTRLRLCSKGVTPKRKANSLRSPPRSLDEECKQIYSTRTLAYSLKVALSCAKLRAANIALNL